MDITTIKLAGDCTSGLPTSPLTRARFLLIPTSGLPSVMLLPRSSISALIASMSSVIWESGMQYRQRGAELYLSEQAGPVCQASAHLNTMVQYLVRWWLLTCLNCSLAWARLWLRPRYSPSWLSN